MGIIEARNWSSQLNGGTFTWFKGESNHCASRLDRFLISEGRDEQFKLIKQRVLPRLTSDHCPIMLECGDWRKGKDISNLRICGLNTRNLQTWFINGGNHTNIQRKPDAVLARS